MSPRIEGFIPEDYNGDPVTKSGIIEVGDPRRREPDHWPIAIGKEDRLNRDASAWWVKTDDDQDPERSENWSRFKGHRVQVDVEFHTYNRREVNDWKGVDEIRASGEWTILLNRQPAWSGHLGSDIPRALEMIKRRIEWLLGPDCPISWHTGQTWASLHGRKIYYRDTPSVITADVASQGCVIIEPDVEGMYMFPAAPWQDNDGGYYVEREIKVELDDKNIWWWRDGDTT